VRFRLGGAESVPRFAGSFRTKRDADTRRAWVLGELAAMRVPDVRAIAAPTAATLNDAAERWRTSRVDVSVGTMQTYRVALGRLKPRLGTTGIDRIDAQTVADLVAELHSAELR
jgi:hypothetical protein